VSELKSLGRYAIKRVLGKGTMGLVDDGHDATLDRRVAIKTILTRNLDEATAKHYEMRFRREVHAVARLNHPNIVQVYDFGTEGHLAYIVMEYIQSRELKDLLDAKQALELGKIFKLMGELLDALDFAHEAGVIHRDIKPANVLIDSAGHAKLADFGVARVTETEGEQGEATRAGAMVAPRHTCRRSRSRGKRSTGGRTFFRPASSSTSSSPGRSRSTAQVSCSRRRSCRTIRSELAKPAERSQGVHPRAACQRARL
jgi:serine/threonine protein kinase